jgi:DNA-directed RNA polymerase specialized sigma subunit
MADGLGMAKTLQEIAQAEEQKISRIKQLAALEAELEGAVKKAGFDSLSAFIQERETLTGEVAPKKKTTKAKAPKAKTGDRKTRVEITPERRHNIVNALKGGKQSTAEIAKEFGVSTSSVSNIKKEEGLTKARA